MCNEAFNGSNYTLAVTNPGVQERNSFTYLTSDNNLNIKIQDENGEFVDFFKDHRLVRLL